MLNQRHAISASRVANRAGTRGPRAGAIVLVGFAACTGFSIPANAGLSLTPVVLDFAPDKPPRADLDLFNSGNERLFVVVQPSKIEAAGTNVERRVQYVDPQQLGLLATPPQLILEPGQRKYVRIVLLAPAENRDRIYRVTVKPVTGGVEAAQTGLKILVGYDVLVIQRPQVPAAQIAALRSETSLTLSNNGNTNAELFNGRQCDTQQHCTTLPSHRLYAGASWTISIAPKIPVNYSMKVGGVVTAQTY